MGEIFDWAITPASVRTLSALTRPLLPPSHAAPRTPAMSAPSVAALGKSSAVSRPASATMRPAACAVSTQRAMTSSSRIPNKPGPLLSLVSSSTPVAPFSAAIRIALRQSLSSAYAASTSAHRAIRTGTVVLTKEIPVSAPTGAASPSPRAALTGRRPATAATIAERAKGETGPSAPREGSLASMISAPPVTAAAASMASATLTNSCMLALP